MLAAATGRPSPKERQRAIARKRPAGGMPSFRLPVWAVGRANVAAAGDGRCLGTCWKYNGGLYSIARRSVAARQTFVLNYDIFGLPPFALPPIMFFLRDSSWVGGECRRSHDLVVDGWHGLVRVYPAVRRVLVILFVHSREREVASTFCFCFMMRLGG